MDWTYVLINFPLWSSSTSFISLSAFSISFSSGILTNQTFYHKYLEKPQIDFPVHTNISQPFFHNFHTHLQMAAAFRHTNQVLSITVSVIEEIQLQNFWAMLIAFYLTYEWIYSTTIFTAPFSIFISDLINLIGILESHMFNLYSHSKSNFEST